MADWLQILYDLRWFLFTTVWLFSLLKYGKDIEKIKKK